VHAAQGATVDTSHTVVTTRTGPAALYVGMSRGRHNNTAHIATTATIDDPAHGRPDQTLHRHPVAMLAGLLDPDDTRVARSALAVAAGSTTDNGSVRAVVELLADAAQLAATDRTARWLDDLTAAGTLTLKARQRIAAEDGAATLTRILRRVELAGHDPRAVLTAAISDRPLDGARNLSSVLHTRITDRGLPLDPTGETWASRVPLVDDPDWHVYLHRLAAIADDRVDELGAAAAAEPPSWAMEEFGRPPDEPEQRREWQAAVAAVAVHRELVQHTGDGDVVGRAPRARQVEYYAAYRHAWRALGRPEISRDVAELTDGQLRMRVRAWEREQSFAPRYVGNELAATRQAADNQRRDATLRHAEADTALPADQARFRQEAAEAAALAAVLDSRVDDLIKLDDARSRWLAHTAGSRAAAGEATAILAQRHADTDRDPAVTAEEWLAAARDADRLDDLHREITETDIDHATDRDRMPTIERAVDSVLSETGVDDIRDVAAGEPRQAHEDVVRVPNANDVAASLDRAARALAEIEAPNLTDHQAEADARAYELARWHADDHTADLGSKLDGTRAVEIT